MSSEDIITLERNDNSSCKIHLFGATLTSWVNKGQEMIFVSSKAVYNKKKAIRGGIPLVFPNFGPWELGPQHGFARTSIWQTSAPQQDSKGNPVAVFTLQDNDETRKMWNFKFQLTYTVTLEDNSLRTDFSVENRDTNQFDFTCLLHTYLRFDDSSKATVSGLHGLKYVDKKRNGDTFNEDRELVTVAENVDRVYVDSPAEHTITNAGGGKSILIHKTNLPDTVVWNPWTTAESMADMADDEYPRMLCIEAGYVSKRKILLAGENFEASQTISVQ